MSGECYSMEVGTPLKGNKVMETNCSQLIQDGNKNINQLLEYETMVSSAENKCNQLKSQLERIKQYYSSQSEAKFPKSSYSNSTKKPSAKKQATKMIRQNSNAISTDRTGAALGTINNILTGITKSMQVPDLLPKSKIPEVQSCSQLGSGQVFGVDEVTINTKSKQSIQLKSKPKISKSKVAAITSSRNFKKMRKATASLPDKRHSKSSESQIPKIAPAINKRGRKLLSKPKVSVFETEKKSNVVPSIVKHSARNPDLVEIYHNNAVKQTKSSDSDINKKKHKVGEKVETDVEVIPPLNIEENENQDQNKGVVSIYKNYTMPTISSRMKQAAKFYMHSFNIKTIPFCLSTSTSPSHNIGINIQQVISMVKTKQPVGKLSPTLAYNIGLAAGKWEDNPLSILGSTVTTRAFPSQCPLSRSTVNYQHLQEIAKTIPQDIIEENEEIEETEVSPETRSVIITGPSGDVKVINKKQTIWSANTEEKRCTCVVPKGIGFQQIVNKFNGIATKPKSTSPSIIKMKGRKSKQIGCGEAGQQTDFMPLHNKEKKLKEVLGKLHDEFETMTKTYDELVKRNDEGKATPDALQQLEKLDNELNSKEEEIVMVMTLYKEVLALKQQVKTLKERASKESVSMHNQVPKIGGKNMETAGLLNKLLQRLHYYQTHYKKH
ncbi:uncharacterized protein LOC123004745 [Tribolium madens]|uniref:uncharacterized protein LOC123004745 n=1 Tax=Tribolium madens TaxID=41895 RepID=UPI001CF745BB|nr:uncharacterized protein LOC123004745 [Tribolium madens]